MASVLWTDLGALIFFLWSLCVIVPNQIPLKPTADTSGLECLELSEFTAIEFNSAGAGWTNVSVYVR